MSIEQDKTVEKVNQQLSELNRRTILSNMQMAKRNTLRQLLRRYVIEGERSEKLFARMKKAMKL